jgi:hypothetical protein
VLGERALVPPAPQAPDGAPGLRRDHRKFRYLSHERSDDGHEESTVKGALTIRSIARSPTMVKEDADKRTVAKSGARRVKESVYMWRRVDSFTGRISMTFAVRSQS